MLNLWAGQTHSLIDHDVDAAAVMRRLERELRDALAAAVEWQGRLGDPVMPDSANSGE